MKKLISYFLIAAVAFSLTGCATQEAKDITVETTTADIKQINTTIDIAGALVPNKTENITSKLSGTVKQINAEVGQKVNKDDVLVVLDTKELDAQLNQAQAGYNSTKDQTSVAKTNLDAAQSGVNVTKLTIADQIKTAKLNLDSAKQAIDATKEQNSVQLSQVQFNIDNAKKNYDRIKQLYESNLVSQSDYDNAKATYDNAKNQYNIAEAAAKSSLLAAQTRYDAAVATYNQTSGSAAEGQLVAAQSKVDVAKKQYDASSTSGLKQAEASINTIKVQLSNSSIVSSTTGVVVNKNINQGELAAAGTPLITIADISKLMLKGVISQEAIPYVAKGNQVDVSIDIYPNKTFKGIIDSVGPMAVSTSSYFPVQISIDNADMAIPAGVSAHAKISIDNAGQVVVPTTSIVENNGATYLFAIENGIAVKKAVIVGLKNNDEAEILSGLAKGEVIAVSNVNALFDKMPVQVKNN